MPCVVLWSDSILITQHTWMYTVKIAGNFKTQILSNTISGVCAIVLIFSTWQYTLNQPACCPSGYENSTTPSTLRAEHTGDCEEIQRNILLPSLNLNIPPTVNIVICVVVLVVRCVMESLLDSYTLCIIASRAFTQRTTVTDEDRTGWSLFKL